MSQEELPENQEEQPQQPAPEPEEYALLVLSADDLPEVEDQAPSPGEREQWGAPLVIEKDELLAEPEESSAPAAPTGEVFDQGPGFLPVKMLAACTKTGKPYALVFRPDPDGTMSCIGDEPLPSGPDFDPNDFKQQMGREEVVAKGGFLMDQYQGCPFCGARQYALCSCGTAMCTGGLHRGLLKSTLKCPICGNKGMVDHKPVTRGVRYGGGGKSGKYRSK